MQHIDWLLTYVWEVWLDEIFDKYSLIQLSKLQHVLSNICFDFFFSFCNHNIYILTVTRLFEKFFLEFSILV